MSRTPKRRLIQMAPHFYGFLPFGLQSKKTSDVFINFAEYEAINLCDYELLTQAEAAKLMNVSRPTFTRIYESARRKTAKAFIEGRIIRFEGGNVTLARWFTCEPCGITFSLSDDSIRYCPLCKSEMVTENY